MSGEFGFIEAADKPVTDLQQKVTRTASEGARRTFSPEFINRLDKVVVFSPLNQEQLCEILELELRQVQMRILQTAKVPFLLRVEAAGSEFLLGEGSGPALRCTSFEEGYREVPRHSLANWPFGKRSASPNPITLLRSSRSKGGSCESIATTSSWDRVQ